MFGLFKMLFGSPAPAPSGAGNGHTGTPERHGALEDDDSQILNSALSKADDCIEKIAAMTDAIEAEIEGGTRRRVR